MKAFNRFLVIVMLVSLLLTGGGNAAGQAGLQAGSPVYVPRVVSYQGYVTVDGQPFTGEGAFKFALLDAAKTTSFWSNDGTSTAGAEPTAAVPLAVTEGYFTVLLGDTTLTGMTAPLTDAHFNQGDRYLRVWFSAGGGTFTRLDPDQRITAVPYALNAGSADTLDGISSEGFAASTHNHPPAAISPQGKGSGLDADLLDGISSAGFAASAHTHAPAEITPQGAGSGLGADTLDGQEGSYYQARVSGACAPGSTIRLINANGTVECAPGSANPGFARTVVDDLPGSTGSYTSLTVGVDGLPLISYYDTSLTALKVAHCHDLACTSKTITVLDDPANTDTGLYTSIAIGQDGLGLISYHDASHKDLKVAHCLNLDCSSAEFSTPDSTGYVGTHTSLAIGADGLGLIAYRDETNARMKIAHCDNMACSTSQIYLPTSRSETNPNGLSNSVTINGDGVPLFISTDDYNQIVSYACINPDCSTNTYHTSTIPISGKIAVTTGSDGRGLIAVASDNLYIIHCQDLPCSSRQMTTISLPSTIFEDISISVGADGLGIISYYDVNDQRLMGFHCSNLACDVLTQNLLDDPTVGDVGQDTAISIGPDGLPLVAYRDVGTEDLVLMHCSNPFCVPYFRRR